MQHNPLITFLIAGAVASGAIGPGTPPAHGGELTIPEYRSSAIRPEPEFAYFNPAFAYVDPEIDQRLGLRIPLGLLAIATIPERNPFLYETDPETFRSRFDFLSFYDQLQYPSSFLLNPGTSPEEIVARIRKDSLAVEYGDGSPLRFDSATDTDGVARPLSPRLPPPLAIYSHRIDSPRYGSVVTATSLFLSTTGHSLEAEKNLQRVLEGNATEPDITYHFVGTASATGGVSQTVSYPLRVTAPRASVVLAPRLVGYYRAATVQAKLDATIGTDENAVPRGVDASERVFLSYPGNGYGYGGRVDVGTAVVSDNIRAGVAVLNLVGFDRITGTRHTYQAATTETHTVKTDDTPPVGVLTFQHTHRWIGLTLITGADAVVGEGVAGHASFTVLRGPWLVRAVGGYRHGWEASFTVGLRSERARRTLPRPVPARLALSLNLHQSPFSRTTVWGLGMRIGI
ncbi:MAG: hypothetical protein WD492_15655 [Alkalispirochaeta sp.]